MSTSALKLLRRYQYDPLDRLTGVGLLAGDSTQCFYQEAHLTTELGPQTQRTILRHAAQPLAQSQREAGVTDTTLLATDQAHSLLQTHSGVSSRQFAYTAYGHHPAASGLSRLFGFTGECPDGITGHYPLGQGNRFFNPVLMRFNSPDELSPFEEGGINAYAYCGNDPINFRDPTGNVRFALMMNRGRPSVIVKPNNSSAIARPNRSSVIVNPRNKTSQSAHEPRVGGLPNQPIQSSSSRNSTSPLIAQDVSFEPNFNLTESFSRRDAAPITRGGNRYRQLVDAGERYDRYKKNVPDFKTYATPEMITKWQKHKQQSLDFSTHGGNHTEFYNSNARVRKAELYIKEYSVKKHETARGSLQ